MTVGKGMSTDAGREIIQNSTSQNDSGESAFRFVRDTLLLTACSEREYCMG